MIMISPLASENVHCTTETLWCRNIPRWTLKTGFIIEQNLADVIFDWPCTRVKGLSLILSLSKQQTKTRMDSSQV